MSFDQEITNPYRNQIIAILQQTSFLVHDEGMNGQNPYVKVWGCMVVQV